MGTRVLDRHGNPFPTDEVRRRIGFLGGDYLPADSGGEVIAPQMPTPREPLYAMLDRDPEEARRV